MSPILPFLLDVALTLSPECPVFEQKSCAFTRHAVDANNKNKFTNLEYLIFAYIIIYSSILK